MTKKTKSKETPRTTPSPAQHDRRSRLPAIVLDYLRPDLHRAVAMRAVAEGVTMKTIVLRALKKDGLPVTEADLIDGRKRRGQS